MPLGITVAEVFAAANLTPCGPSLWGSAIDEAQPGVYIVSVASDPNTCFGLFDPPQLPHDLMQKWVAEEPVVYIGRTRRPLRQRVRELYRHRYGRKSPHSGGQAALLLKPDLRVFWAATPDPVAAQREMIEAFRRRTGALPFANRCRGAVPLMDGIERMEGIVPRPEGAHLHAAHA